MPTAQDLGLHSESEGEEDPGAAEGYEEEEEENPDEDGDKEEPEEPIVLKSWVGFVRNNSNKNSPSPTPPKESKEQNNDADGSATGIPPSSIYMASHRLNAASESDSQPEENYFKVRHQHHPNKRPRVENREARQILYLHTSH